MRVGILTGPVDQRVGFGHGSLVAQVEGGAPLETKQDVLHPTVH